MRRSSIWLTAAAIVTVLSMSVAARADSHPRGWLWGEIRTADNEPAPNVAVAIVRIEDGRTVSPALRTQTDLKGRYVIDISKLEAGNYVIIVNPGPTMAGGHQGGQTTISLKGPNDSKHLDWKLTENPPVLPVPSRD